MDENEIMKDEVVKDEIIKVENVENIQNENNENKNENMEMLTETNRKIDRLTQLFSDKISEDETRGKLFERMHEELKQYREDFIFDKILRRCFMDIIKLYDRIVSVKNQFVRVGESKDSVTAIESFSRELLQVLKKQEVIPVKPQSNVFDERFQEAVETEYTVNPEEDLTIAEVIKQGFVYKGRIMLRPEIVKIKKYKEEK